MSLTPFSKPGFRLTIAYKKAMKIHLLFRRAGYAGREKPPYPEYACEKMRGYCDEFYGRGLFRMYGAHEVKIK